MKKNLFTVLILMAAMVTIYIAILRPSPGSMVQITTFPEQKKEFLLLPLDSRPPCGKFTQDLGKIAGIKVTAAPHELMDYYSQPGDTKALKQWLAESLPGTDGVIISIDQLIYGGLLGARERKASEKDIDDALDFLRELHKNNPNIPIYAFNILPRITPPDTIEGYKERRQLIRYSRVLDEFSLSGSPMDYERLQKERQGLPEEMIEKYMGLFRDNAKLNLQLIALTEEGVLSRLVIGQDDGELFGVPNIEKRRLADYLSKKNISKNKVAITHGADELSQTMLAEVCNPLSSPVRVFIDYNSPSTKSLIMPYMAVSSRATVTEKLSLLGCTEAASPDEADIILFISCGNVKNLSQRSESAGRIGKYLRQGKQVALVDLGQHFDASEVLFPIMLKQNIPINSLAAYSGWNTASNSIGTALSQAIIFHQALENTENVHDAESVIYANTVFLNNRFLEDYYYLKDTITQVNNNLKKNGYTNVYDLDLEHNYQWADDMLKKSMSASIAQLKAEKAYSVPFSINTRYGTLNFCARDLNGDMSFPWPRTFEIWLQSSVGLYRIK